MVIQLLKCLLKLIHVIIFGLKLMAHSIDRSIYIKYIYQYCQIWTDEPSTGIIRIYVDDVDFLELNQFVRRNTFNQSSITRTDYYGCGNQYMTKWVMGPNCIFVFGKHFVPTKSSIVFNHANNRLYITVVLDKEESY